MYTCIYMIAPHEVSHHCPLWTICIYIHINKQRRPLNLFTCIHNIEHTRKLQDTKDPPGMPKQVRYFHWIGQCPLVSFQTTETENKATLSTVTLGYCTVTTFFSLTWGSGAVLIKQLNATCLVRCVLGPAWTPAPALWLPPTAHRRQHGAVQSYHPADTHKLHRIHMVMW